MVSSQAHALQKALNSGLPGGDTDVASAAMKESQKKPFQCRTMVVENYPFEFYEGVP
jgi:hypothetical protein